MALLVRHSIINLIIYSIISVSVANADQCRKSCGYIATKTVAFHNKACYETGITINITNQINWDDSSYSIFSATSDIQLVIGSCCSKFTYSQYNTGVVISGRFTGDSVRQINTLSDKNIACNDCQSISGSNRNAGTSLLSIGIKGVGQQWIQCTGNVTLLYSPPLTLTPQSVYSTFSLFYDDCNDCVESC